jgi:hypothetical protein
MPSLSSAEKRLVARITPVQLDLFMPAPVQAGVAGAHHAVTAPGASRPVAGTLTVPPPLENVAVDAFQFPCGLWRGKRIGYGYASSLHGVSKIDRCWERRL